MQNPKLYLSRVIADAKNECEGGYVELSRRIRAANAATDASTVDRRKLKDIAEGCQFTISLKELVALDNYFSLSGHGLADHPFFQRQTLLQGLAENEKIVFLMGAFPRDEEARNDVSLWDVRAFQVIVSEAQKLRPGIQESLQDVFFLDHQGLHNKNPSGCNAILDRPRLSVCSIGSPKANVVTEMILAEMFHQKPFVRPTKTVPFKFHWPGEEDRRQIHFASAFVARPEEFAQKPAKFGSTRPRRSVGGLVVGDEVYDVVPQSGKSWHDYAIIAIQRKKGGRVRLVIAGVTGPTTYAAALACRAKLTASIPPPDTKGDSSVLWAVVKARIKSKAQGFGDIRDVESVDLVGDLRGTGPDRFDPDKRKIFHSFDREGKLR